MRLRRDQTIEVSDVEGGQVADVVAFAAGDPDDWMSSGRTFDYAGKILLTTGDVLWSQRSRRIPAASATAERRPSQAMTSGAVSARPSASRTVALALP